MEPQSCVYQLAGNWKDETLTTAIASGLHAYMHTSSGYSSAEQSPSPEENRSRAQHQLVVTPPPKVTHAASYVRFKGQGESPDLHGDVKTDPALQSPANSSGSSCSSREKSPRENDRSCGSTDSGRSSSCSSNSGGGGNKRKRESESRSRTVKTKFSQQDLPPAPARKVKSIFEDMDKLAQSSAKSEAPLDLSSHRPDDSLLTSTPVIRPLPRYGYAHSFALVPPVTTAYPPPAMEQGYLRDVLRRQEGVLFEMLMTSEEAELRRVKSVYEREIERLETERHKSLMVNVTNEAYKNYIHNYFDHERLSLVIRTQRLIRPDVLFASPPDFGQFTAAAAMTSPPSVAGYMGHAGLPALFSPITAGRVGSPAEQLSSGYGSSPASCGTPIHNPQQLPRDSESENGGNPLSRSSAVNSTSIADSKPNSSFTSPEYEDGNSRRKFLSPHAVNVLSEWYTAHSEHPYPTEEMVLEISSKANISANQVKKWMANKRVRSSNTLAHNGSIHPKKLQKLMQLREVALADDSTPSKVKVEGGSAGKRSKRMLDQKATDILSAWYREHMMYPYPTEQQKTELAASCGLSITQVTCWFANKRNRAHTQRSRGSSTTKTRSRSGEDWSQFIDLLKAQRDQAQHALEDVVEGRPLQRNSPIEHSYTPKDQTRLSTSDSDPTLTLRASTLRNDLSRSSLSPSSSDIDPCESESEELSANSSKSE